jgi:hypothetical protein
MRRSVARLAAFVLVIATAANAKWDVLSVNGTAKDVQVADAGYFAIATNTGAYAMLSDGGSPITALSATTFISAFIEPNGCLGAVQNAGGTTFASSCATSVTWVPSVPPISYRQTQAGSAYLTAYSASQGIRFLYSPTGGFQNDWQPIDVSGVSIIQPSAVSDALRVGTTDVGLFVIVGTQRYGYAQNAGALTGFGQNVGGLEKSVSLLDATSALAVEADGGVTTITGTPAASFGSIVTPPSSAIAFSPGTDIDGAGFGLLAPIAGATQPFQNTVPNPAAPGASWVPNSAPLPAYQGIVQRISCLGARFCVAITDNPDAGNVLVYENASPPAADVQPLLVLDAGVTVTLNVDAGDPDGEPTRLFWSTDAGAAVTITPQGPDGRVVQVTTGANTMPCATPTADFGAEAIASDGLAAHRVPYPFTVQVPRILSPAANSTLTVAASYDPATNSLTGTATANNLNCPLDRSARIDITFLDQAGATLGSTTINGVSGPFSQPLQGCAGGSFTVSAQLTDSTGVGPPATPSVTALAVPAKVGTISTPTLVARCGQPVAAQLSTAPAAGGCAGESFAWHQVSGPALTTPVQSGAQFQLETVSSSPKDLIGQSVTLAIDADAGNGTTDQATTTIPIGAEPFVSVTHETPSSSDPDLPRTVSVSIDNPTGCDLPTTSLIEQLGGGQFVEGSAKLDGQPVTASVSGGALRIDGIPIEAGGHHMLSFDTRPSILGVQTPGGELTYRDVPVSQAAVNTGQVPANVGCGCHSASEGSWIVIILGLVLLVNARKRNET